MSDVFLSYKREDEERVRLLREGLIGETVSVWWDRDIGGGETWRQTIEDEIERAACVVVVWSERSVGPGGAFVRDEAQRANRRGTLLPVRIDPVDPPLGFGELQSLDLVGWKGRRADARFQDVLGAIRAKVERRPPQALRWPAIKRRRRTLTWLGGGGVSSLLALMALILSPNLQQVACRVPGVRAVCGAAGLAHIAGPDEVRLWESALGRSDGAGLRGYLGLYPRGAFVDEARSRLAACHVVEYASWRVETKRLAQFIAKGAELSRTEAEAQAKARERGAIDARDRICAAYASSATYRLQDATTEPTTWDCRRLPNGVTCGFDGWAVCKLQVKVVDRREACW